MPDGKETSRQQPIQQILHSCPRTLIIHPQTLKRTSDLCFLNAININHEEKLEFSNNSFITIPTVRTYYEVLWKKALRKFCQNKGFLRPLYFCIKAES